MVPISVLFGIILIAIGLISYLISESKSMTAFIPAVFGVLLLICAVGVMLMPGKRKHFMHAAAAIGLIGLIGATVMVVRKLQGEGELNLAFFAQAAMAVTCALFLGMCVKSFIDARRGPRQENE